MQLAKFTAGIYLLHTLIWQSSTPSASSACTRLTVSTNMYLLRHIHAPSVGEKRRLAPVHTHDVLSLFAPCVLLPHVLQFLTPVENQMTIIHAIIIIRFISLPLRSL